MQQKIFHILSEPGSVKAVDAHVSFKPFVAYLETRLKNEQTLRVQFYDFVLKLFKNAPELAKPVNVRVLQKHTGLLDLLYTCLFPPLSDENQVLAAFCAPNSDTIFFSTPAFYNLMSPDNKNRMFATATEAEKEAFKSSIGQVKYKLILERFYNVEPFISDEIVYALTDKETGLPKYYSINIDHRFVNVYHDASANNVNASMIKTLLRDVRSLYEMEDALPLERFTFEGFSIVTATDITARYALHKMRSAIIRHTPENFDKTYETILFLLQALCGTSKVQFGLMPFIKVNNKPVVIYGNYKHSIAINIARQQQVPEAVFSEWINGHFQEPNVVFYKDWSHVDIKDKNFYPAFESSGLKGYAQLPVYHNNELAGMLELSSSTENALNERLLARLDAAMAILAQLLHNNQVEFRAGIDKIIKTNFTSIQPAVQWKFNEVAWNFIKNKVEGGIGPELESIRFEQVYPLFGALDIRNSTIERNNALYKDIQFYFVFLDEILKKLPADGDNTLMNLRAEAADLQKQTSMYLSGSDETSVLKFMERVATYFQWFAMMHPAETADVNRYHEAMDATTGDVHANRRALEKSMAMINSSINKYLELMQVEFEQQYPAYFEKFRTDGVEYDIYIGQSLNPQQPYKDDYLHQLRQWQLSSMAAIARLVHLNKPLMPVYLQTTQLIYVNANAIDISFRTDEKRFDVEGGYNIRYHIIKKRIDKVHIKDTGERLTQPNKIAIVYSKKNHEEEYLQYITKLQHEGLLKHDTEVLDLEELQGVNGLKAIRVGIEMEYKSES